MCHHVMLSCDMIMWSSHVNSLMIMCHLIISNDNDLKKKKPDNILSMTPASPSPPPASPMPPPSHPVHAHQAAKGKEVTVLVDSPPPLKAKASGSLKGTKFWAPSPGLARPHDIRQDAPTTSNLPEVQMELLTRTGYPGFLCSKDVWVILTLSVSILVPLRE